ncbi:MAG TPA: DUF3179 domain-containing (seleno)protein [Bacteroidia bacterium]|nr:DUF3179 domain-containing (seleno)protein [Bacteroidia bacterium]
MKLKLLFHFSLIALIAFEIYKAYLILPFPGSQEMPAADTAWFLYHYRWFIRLLLFAGVVVGFMKAFEKRKWIPFLTLFLTGFVVYMTNFKMTAESMFHEAEKLEFAAPASGKIPMDALVIGVTHNGVSKAYPIRYLTFHHQVQDTVGGKNILVTYCSVCRSGIVFEPTVNGKHETFRLVGMDQFNAMFEDKTTGSWWRQVNGECVAGELKGQTLPLVESEQLTLAQWAKRHPNGKVMLPDASSVSGYDDETFEKGRDTSSLTGTDTASWHDKSWVVGVEYKGNYRAYDWNQLKRERVINDVIAGEPVVISIDSANVNFHAWVIKMAPVSNTSDTLQYMSAPVGAFTPIPARQMFWHTWRTFYPATTRYGVK